MRNLLLTGAFVLAVVALWLSLPVAAHEFYDPWCCNEQDCAPYFGVVEERQDGFWVPEFQTLVPYNKARYDVPSHDPYQYHLCEYPKGTLRCFYAKPGGV